MRIGVLGCGAIAYWAHLRTLARMPEARLAAAADPDAAARERAHRLTGAPVYHSAEEVLGRSDVDAVVICTPTCTHADLAVAAASAGKHFYVEKPIAISAADGHRVLAAAARAGVIGVVGFNRRFHPLFQQARALLAAGRIGRIRAVQTAFCESIEVAAMPEWKRRRETGGGVLLDLASHHFDLLRWFLDDEVASVAGYLRSDLSEHETARLELSTQNGVEVQSLFSFRTGLADFLEFYGDGGTLRVDRHATTLELRVPRRWGYGVRHPWVPPTASGLAWRAHRLVRPSVDHSYRRSLRAFVELLQGRPAGSASLVDGMRSLETILNAEESVACALS